MHRNDVTRSANVVAAVEIWSVIGITAGCVGDRLREENRQILCMAHTALGSAILLIHRPPNPRNYLQFS
jgi:hypothetical protein